MFTDRRVSEAAGGIAHHLLIQLHTHRSRLGEEVQSFFAGDASWHGRTVHFVPSEVFFQVTAGLLPLVGLVATLVGGNGQPGVSAGASPVGARAIRAKH